MTKEATIEDVFYMVVERAGWGHRHRVTASALSEKFGLTLSQARDLMSACHGREGLKLNLVRGQWSGAFLTVV